MVEARGSVLSVVGSTAGMVGDLQGIAGKAMPELPSLDISLLETSAVFFFFFLGGGGGMHRNDVMGANSTLRPLRFAIAPPAYPELTQEMCGLAIFI